MPITTIAFDADDTLWHNESVFEMTQAHFAEILQRHAPDTDVDGALLERERANLHLFGYGVKGFTLSMIETAIEVTGGRATADDIQEILDAGKKMLSHPVDLLDGVREVVVDLSRSYRLLLITKGDLFDQENKVARSGLADLFDAVEIVSEKDVPTYRRILSDHGIEPSSLLMVGNSVKSDILPVLEIGARAAHIPYRITWEMERVDGPLPEGGVRLDRITEVPSHAAALD